MADWRRHVEKAETGKDGKELTRLVIAGRNKDLRVLNGLLRQAWQESGRLSGDEHVVRAVPRGQEAAVDFPIRCGDVIAFSERVELPNQPVVNNGDTGRIIAINGDADDPVVQFRFDSDGREIAGRVSQFVGKRLRGDTKPKVPLWSYGHAVSANVSQGKTVSDSWTYGAMGDGRLDGHRHRETRPPPFA